jgi:Flp pilus assembly protein TadD
MNTFLGWLRQLRGQRSSSSSPAGGDSDLLQRARALALAGSMDEASEVYWKIKRKHQTAEGLVEHAEILLGMGDHFGAASRAARALELDPEDARAKLVQRRVRESEESESRRV